MANKCNTITLLLDNDFILKTLEPAWVPEPNLRLQKYAGFEPTTQKLCWVPVGCRAFYLMPDQGSGLEPEGSGFQPTT